MHRWLLLPPNRASSGARANPPELAPPRAGDTSSSRGHGHLCRLWWFRNPNATLGPKCAGNRDIAGEEEEPRFPSRKLLRFVLSPAAERAPGSLQAASLGDLEMLRLRSGCGLCCVQSGTPYWYRYHEAGAAGGHSAHSLQFCVRAMLWGKDWPFSAPRWAGGGRSGTAAFGDLILVPQPLHAWRR